MSHLNICHLLKCALQKVNKRNSTINVNNINNETVTDRGEKTQVYLCWKIREE